MGVRTSVIDVEGPGAVIGSGVTDVGGAGIVEFGCASRIVEFGCASHKRMHQRY